MRIRKIMVLLMIPLLAACLYGIYVLQTFHAEGSKDMKIIAVLKTNDIRTEFWQTVSAGVKAAAKEFDAKVDIRGPLAETDTVEQIHLLEQALLEKPDAIIIAPINFNLVEPLAKKIRRTEIKLVMIDSTLNGSLAQSFISNDNIEAGKKAGQTLAAMTNGKPKTAIINDFQNSVTAMEREKGIKQVLTSYQISQNYGTYSCQGQEDKAYDITKTLLVDHPDITGIISLNETAALGAAKAIKEKNKVDQVKLIGFDASIYEIKLLEEGILQATIVQKPFNMGYLGVKTAVQLIQGEHPKAKLDIESTVITKENMYTQENQKLLFPFIER